MRQTPLLRHRSNPTIRVRGKTKTDIEVPFVGVVIAGWKPVAFCFHNFSAAGKMGA
jgi:hypothetical protein